VLSIPESARGTAEGELHWDEREGEQQLKGMMGRMQGPREPLEWLLVATPGVKAHNARQIFIRFLDTISSRSEEPHLSADGSRLSSRGFHFHFHGAKQARCPLYRRWASIAADI
jgi:hypothetical protein